MTNKDRLRLQPVTIGQKVGSGFKLRREVGSRVKSSMIEDLKERDSDIKSEIQSEFTIGLDLDGLYLRCESDQIWTEFHYDFIFSENYYLLEWCVYSRRARNVMILMGKSSTYIDLFCFVPPLTKRNHFMWRREANEF